MLRKRRPSGRFAMESATDVARRTGQTLRDMRATGAKASDNGDNVAGSFELGFATERSANVATHLAQGGREIRGLPKESTARGKAARNRILRIGAGIIKSEAKQRLGVIIDTGKL
jgi:hypothetical protein